MCWAKAEGPGGVISDNSPANQEAIQCEDEGNKAAITDAEMQVCFKEDAEEPLIGKDPKSIPKPGIAAVPPAGPAPTKSPTAPTAKATPKPTTTKPTTTAARPAAKRPTNTNPSGSGTSPESPDRANSYANIDLDACLNARSDASQCCNNPLSCSSSLSYDDQMSLQSLRQQTSSGPKAGQSISEYCSQMRQASASSGSVNNGLSSVCYSNQSSCTSTCSSLVQKYQSLLSNCDGCESESIYMQTLGSLQAAQATCQGLRANVNAMAQQGVGSAGGQAYGSICQQQAGYNPGFDSPNSAYNNYNANNPAFSDTNNCATNPNSEACKAMQQAQEQQKGKVGFQDAKKRDGSSGFNPSSLDADALNGLNSKLSTSTATAQQIANQIQGVPNNTGGAIPGQNGNQQAANLAPGKPAPPAQQGPDTDIMRGNLSGGYSQGSGFESMMQNGSVFRSLASAGGANGMKPAAVDLKKYLPAVGPAHAALYGRSAEINSKTADLFKKISNKVVERCKLGLLWDCKP